MNKLKKMLDSERFINKKRKSEQNNNKHNRMDCIEELVAEKRTPFTQPSKEKFASPEQIAFVLEDERNIEVIDINDGNDINNIQAIFEMMNNQRLSSHYSPRNIQAIKKKPSNNDNRNDKVNDEHQQNAQSYASFIIVKPPFTSESNALPTYGFAMKIMGDAQALVFNPLYYRSVPANERYIKHIASINNIYDLFENNKYVLQIVEKTITNTHLMIWLTKPEDTNSKYILDMFNQRFIHEYIKLYPTVRPHLIPRVATTDTFKTIGSWSQILGDEQTKKLIESRSSEDYLKASKTYLYSYWTPGTIPRNIVKHYHLENKHLHPSDQHHCTEE